MAVPQGGGGGAGSPGKGRQGGRQPTLEDIERNVGTNMVFHGSTLHPKPETRTSTLHPTPEARTSTLHPKPETRTSTLHPSPETRTVDS